MTAHDGNVDVTIVIPVYNEGENISIALQQINDEVKASYEVMVVFDMPEDDTIPVAKRVARELDLPLVLKRNAFGVGALNAIKTGLLCSQTQYVIVMMADLSDPASVINEMLKVVQTSGADIVCASRYMRGGKQVGGPVVKTILSRLAGLSLHYLFGLPTHDATNNFKLYSRSFLQQVKIESEGGFEIALELVVKAHCNGLRIVEVPTTWTDRSAGSSRFHLVSWMPNYLRWYRYAVMSRLRGLRGSLGTDR